MPRTVIEKTWVEYGPNGVIGTLHRVGDGGHSYRLLSDDSPRTEYPSLDIVTGALYTILIPGFEWPEGVGH